MKRRVFRLRGARSPLGRPALSGARAYAPDLLLLLQASVAASVAWVLANAIDPEPAPFFAPMSAIAALNARRGERGLNTLRLLLGVLVGIASGELTAALLGPGIGRLALASFAAMAIARAFGAARMVIGQAGAAAVLTVIAAQDDAGLHRLQDALIGGGVALVFSQVLFSPEPVRLVRRAEARALRGMARALELTAHALERPSDERQADRALQGLRRLHELLAELGQMRRAGGRIVRHSLVWWTRRAPVVREQERAGELELLGASCLMLTRTATVTAHDERLALADAIRTLAAALAELAEDPGARDVRQRAVDRAVEVTRRFEHHRADSDSTLGAAIVALRMLAADLIWFAGVDRAQVAAEVKRTEATR